MTYQRNLQKSKCRQRGLTLLELVVVLAVMAAIAALIVPIYSNIVQDSQITTTRATLTNLQDLILNRYVPEMKDIFPSLPPTSLVRQGFPGSLIARDAANGELQLHFLFVNPGNVIYSPISRRGWNGPYLLPGQSGTYPDPGTSSTPSESGERGFTKFYGLANDLTPLDAWGNPIVIQSRTWNGQSVLVLVSAGSDRKLSAIDSAIDIDVNSNSSNSDDIGMLLRAL